MTENNVTATQTPDTDKAAKKAAKKLAKEAAKVVHPTAEAAMAAKPEGLKLSLCRVTSPDGKTAYVWSPVPDFALARVARTAGWSATNIDKAPTADNLAAGLRLLSPQERAALLAEFAAEAPAKNGRKAK